jgi:hypothetical protein
MSRSGLERGRTMTMAHPVSTSPAAGRAPLRPVDLSIDDYLDDEPVPIPASWSGRALTRRAPRRFQELRWGLVGFGLGLAVVVPSVLIATGDLGPWAEMPWPRAAEIAVSETSSTNAGSFSTASALPSALAFAGQTRTNGDTASRTLVLPEPETAIRNLTVTPVAAATASAARRSAVNPEIVIMEARGLIAGGEILAARAVLEEARSTASGSVLYLLAETYDPERLQSWAVTSVEGDIDKARGIYMLAMLAGVEKAGDRIRALQGR